VNKLILPFFFCTVLTFVAIGCTKKTSDTQRTQPMDAILNGTFATDAAMQEERVQQDNYISEQEQRYE
jgi:hypothetical protein